MDNKFAEKPLTEFPRLRLLLHFLLVVVLWATTRGALAVDHSLAREARPILSEYCFACHGPDEAKRKEGLRLDTQEGIEASGVLKPDDSGESPLLQRLFSHDPNFVMPPPEAHRKPTDADLQILKRWIEAGAPYESHWAFQPILEIAPPQVEDNTGWAETPIDAFVLQKLNEKGVKPSPTTAKETLIRRLSLDLTGLPPTLDEVDAFLNDQEPGAYERLIDRLLASPTYGERMANDWMDLARYADTFGYQNDVENQVWPWRDWLIRSFNQNQPYDEFLTWLEEGFEAIPPEVRCPLEGSSSAA